jgi:hypothetical protein
VVELDISRKVNWRWMADFMAPSISGSNWNGFFPVGMPEGARLRSPSQDYRRSYGAAVTTVSANILRRVRKNAVRRTASYLEMGGGHLESLM